MKKNLKNKYNRNSKLKKNYIKFKYLLYCPNSLNLNIKNNKSINIYGLINDKSERLSKTI